MLTVTQHVSIVQALDNILAEAATHHITSIRPRVFSHVQLAIMERTRHGTANLVTFLIQIVIYALDLQVKSASTVKVATSFRAQRAEQGALKAHTQIPCSISALTAVQNVVFVQQVSQVIVLHVLQEIIYRAQAFAIQIALLASMETIYL